jgi:hypothetical protein
MRDESSSGRGNGQFQGMTFHGNAG